MLHGGQKLKEQIFWLSELGDEVFLERDYTKKHSCPQDFNHYDKQITSSIPKNNISEVRT